MENSKQKCKICGKELQNRENFKTCESCLKKLELRETLFAKYFEEEPNRIKLSDLKEQILYIAEIYEKLNNLLKETIEDYGWLSSIETVKFVIIQNTNFLIIKIRVGKYLIVDIKNKHVLTEKEITAHFNKRFFEENFEEEKDWNTYHFLACKDKIDAVINFCLENKELLETSSTILCEFNIKDAWTYLYIWPSKRMVQLGFGASNQFLYEQLFFNIDLTPLRMQDAVTKIGAKKVEEIFSKMEEIRIPVQSIPDIYLHGRTKTRSKKIKTTKE